MQVVITTAVRKCSRARECRTGIGGDHSVRGWPLWSARLSVAVRRRGGSHPFLRQDTVVIDTDQWTQYANSYSL